MIKDMVLKTEGLTKRFGSLTAVKNLNLEVLRGEIFGFLGPNGAGKTTSINMMCGLLKPDGGRVLIEGRPVSDGDGSIRRRVGVAPQEIVLWERLTCLEQLRFMGAMYGVDSRIAEKRAAELLSILGLAEKSRAQARTLSGGMQRRLNLALALVHDPDIIVLDEPEAGLDPQSRLNVRDFVRSLARRKTVILTTHNMDEAERVADRIAIIDHGELLVLDTPQAIKQSAGEGDVVEVSLKDAEGDVEALKSRIPDLAGFRLDTGAKIFSVRALNAVASLPHILETLPACGYPVEEVRVRANTLEDAFIQLTGRRLRE